MKGGKDRDVTAWVDCLLDIAWMDIKGWTNTQKTLSLKIIRWSELLSKIEKLCTAIILTSVDEGISNKWRLGALHWHDIFIGFQENPPVFLNNYSEFTHTHARMHTQTHTHTLK
jgi:hypothetical protein